MQKINKLLEVVTKEFRQNVSDFCQNNDLSKLSPEMALKFEHNLKDSLLEAGKIGFTQWLQSFESPKDLIDIEGKKFRFKKTSKKEFLTQFGQIELERKLYQQDDGGLCHVPVDIQWGMEKEYATADVRQTILYSCGLLTPEETESLLKRFSPFKPSSTAIKNMAKRHGEFEFHNFDGIAEKVREKTSIPKEVSTIVISVDGVNVMLNEPGERKGRKTQQPKDNGLNEGKTCFKNAMVGSISTYTIDEQNKPQRNSGIYTSQMPEDKFISFKKKFENEIENIYRLEQKTENKLLIMDGARGLWNYVNSNEKYKDYERLIDYYHTTDHLSKAAEIIFGKNSEQARKWYKKNKQALKENTDAPNAIYRSMKYYEGKISNTKKELLKKEITFFKRNKRYMSYCDFIQRGLPIGSGPVEAACKSIVKTRLCRSGMRWSRKGGQNILQLRNRIKSQQWDSYWDACMEFKKAA